MIPAVVIVDLEEEHQPAVMLVTLYHHGIPVAYYTMEIFISATRIGGIEVDYDYFEVAEVPLSELCNQPVFY